MKKTGNVLILLVVSGSFLPFVSYANYLVQTPPDGASIIDTGELNCSALVDRGSIYADYSYETTINCNNSFAQTKVIISKIELTNTGARSINIKLGNGVVDSINNGSETKTYAILGSSNNVLDSSISFRYFHQNLDVQLVKVYFNIINQDLSVSFTANADNTSFKQTENHILLSTVGKYFKNLLTLSVPNNNLLERSKLDDIDVTKNRTADFTYQEYENTKGIYFSTFRAITIAEKAKVDIRMNYKEYEFDKELTIPFKIPKSYRKK